MAQDIVVRYRLELDEALKKLDAFAKELEQTDKSATKSAKSLDGTAKSADKLGNEVSQASKQIKDSTKNVDDFSKKGNDTFNKLSGSVKSFALGAGAAIAAAFSVQAIVQFAQSSIDGFLAAEKASERLRFAIIDIGKESEATFDRLEKQADQIEKITIFDADDVMQAQAALAAFGLTGDEIEALIPKLTDFATVAGIDIVSATQQIGAGLEGAGREFKKYGIEVSATASRQQNLNSILAGFGQFAGAAENATKTLSGQLEQSRLRVNALKDEIGESLANAFVRATIAIVDFYEVITGANREQGVFNQLNANLRGVVQNLDQVSEAIARNEPRVNAFIQIYRELVGREQVGEQEVAFAKLVDSVIEQANAFNELVKSGEDINLLYARLSTQQGKIDEAFKSGAISAEQQASATAILKDELKRLGGTYQDLTVAQQRAAAEAKRLAEEQRLAQEKLAKANAERLAKELADFETFKQELERGLDDLDKQLTEALDKLKPTDTDKLRFEIEFVTATQGEDVAFTQVRDRLFADFQAEALAIDAVATDTEEANLRKKISYENYINTLKQLFPDLFATEQIGIEETATVVTETWIEKNQQILQSSSQLISELTNIYSAFTNRQIEEINREKDAQLQSIDAQLQANDEALSLRRISEAEAVRNEKALIAEKTKAEETAAKKERELKRKQAIADKAAALVQIATNTAIAITRAYSDTGPIAGNAFAALVAALGAAQAALVVAQPIPYAKGTKNAKGGLARVGEEGEEIMYVPNGTKVLPNKQTNRYGEVLDAMFDNRFDEYVNRRYIAPALMKEKARRETNQQRSFAENIVQSAMVNPQTGLTYYDMEQLRKKGQRFEDETIEKFTDSLARKLSSSQSIYRS